MSHDFVAVGAGEVAGCCGHKHAVREVNREKISDKIFYLAERLSAIALGIFAAVEFPELFVPTFVFGMILGLAIPGNSVSHHGAITSCSQGFLEQTLGVKLPDSVALLAGFGVTAVHIDHHPEVFARIAGVTVGMKAGQMVRAGIDLCYRKFVDL
jgi:hypothetical protein